MAIVDLTHTIEPAMTVFPGTSPPFLNCVADYSTAGYRETRLELYSHMGTHIDAQSHVYEGGRMLEDYPAEFFVGRAFAVDCTGASNIVLSMLIKWLDIISQCDFLLFYTGWQQYWKHSQYIEDYPLLSDEVVEFIYSSTLKGIGVDMLSVDAVHDTDLPIHKRLLAKDEFLIIENLGNMDGITGCVGRLTALPLKYVASDGAAARVIFEWSDK